MPWLACATHINFFPLALQLTSMITRMYAIESGWSRLERMARAMHACHPNLPLDLWPYLWDTAVTCHNSTAHMHVGKLRPPALQLASSDRDAPLDLKHTFRYGDIAVLSTPSEIRDDKTQPRGKLVHVIGWHPTHHVYHYNDPILDDVGKSGHIHFQDHDIRTGELYSRAISNTALHDFHDTFLSPSDPPPDLFADYFTLKDIISVGEFYDPVDHENYAMIKANIQERPASVTMRAIDFYQYCIPTNLTSHHCALTAFLGTRPVNEEFPLLALTEINISTYVVSARRTVVVSSIKQ